jgi:hypothetical protein
MPEIFERMLGEWAMWKRLTAVCATKLKKWNNPGYIMKNPVFCALLLSIFACATAASENAATEGNAHNPDTAALNYSIKYCPAIQFTDPFYERTNCELRDGVKIATFSVKRDALKKFNDFIGENFSWEEPTSDYPFRYIFIALSDNIPKLLEISGFSKGNNGRYKFNGSSLPPTNFYAKARAFTDDILTKEEVYSRVKKTGDWLIAGKIYYFTEDEDGFDKYAVDCNTSIKLPKPKQERFALAFTQCLFDRYVVNPTVIDDLFERYANFRIPKDFLEKIRAIRVLGSKIPPHIEPSFDCAKATTSIEKMICSNNDLSFLDIRLSQDYQFAMGHVPNIMGFINEQRAWLKSRMACKKVDCLKKLYEERILEICNKYPKTCDYILP